MPTDTKQVRHQQSHERILDAAARALCRDGYAGVGVASVMKEAGLTHGGFYAHFASRDALLAAALEHAAVRSIARMRERVHVRLERGERPLRALVEEYLSLVHVEAPDAGCPVAALGADLHRGEPALRALSAHRVRHLAGLVEGALPAGAPAGAAFFIASSLVGAVQMARVFEGEERDAVLRSCRDGLIGQYARDHASA